MHYKYHFMVPGQQPMAREEHQQHQRLKIAIHEWVTTYPTYNTIAWLAFL